MGKRDKKQHRKSSQHRGGASYYLQDEEQSSYGDESHYTQQHKTLPSDEDQEQEQEVDAQNDGDPLTKMPSKFELYQQSVQSPKGDISYLQKFFLTYVGGRYPLHLQEDFCGTALLSAEWLHSDSRRTSVGLDLDVEALSWCLENNLNKVGSDGYSRMSLFWGNVLEPLESKLVKYEPKVNLIKKVTLNETGDNTKTDASESTLQEENNCVMRNSQLPTRDIVCAFNYSCCCLHKRADLVSYFKNVLGVLSRKGGIFVMDLYGGTSSEHKLKLQRKFPNFTYTWEQAEFNILERKTRISLHFHLQKQQKKLRHAFSYSWRLWSLPEIKDCLEEAGFRSVHFWLREMPDTEENKSTVGFGSGKDVKYEEVESFPQVDAWNAYIIGVA